jgi:hypothetical protein
VAGIAMVTSGPLLGRRTPPPRDATQVVLDGALRAA